MYGATSPNAPPLCLSLSLFLLRLCTSSSSSIPTSVGCLFSNWSHISSLVCRNESLPCSPFVLSPLSTSVSHPLSGSTLFSLPSYIHPPPTSTCSHHCVAPIYGFITAAFHGRGGGKKEWRETRGEETWEMRQGRRALERERTHMIKIY